MDTPLFTIDFLSFNELRQRQVRERSDCHAAFTTIPGGIIWPFANFGNTEAEHKEKNLRGRFPFLDDIADLFLEYYPEGGRFFLSKIGVGTTPENARVPSRLIARLTIQNTAVRPASLRKGQN
jgi:hypothetical protein